MDSEKQAQRRVVVPADQFGNAIETHGKKAIQDAYNFYVWLFCIRRGRHWTEEGQEKRFDVFESRQKENGVRVLELELSGEMPTRTKRIC